MPQHRIIAKIASLELLSRTIAKGIRELPHVDNGLHSSASQFSEAIAFLRRGLFSWSYDHLEERAWALGQMIDYMLVENDFRVLAPITIHYPLRPGTTFISLYELASHLSDILKPTPSEISDEIAIPPQAPGPIQFGLREGRLVSVPQQPQFEDGAAASAAARDAILELVTDLIKSLTHGNCDPRIVSALRALQATLLAHTDLVRAGLQGITLQILLEKCEEELGGPDASAMRSIVHQIAMYAAQDSGWVAFVEKAVLLELTTSDAARIASETRALITTFEAEPHLVDPEVPRTLRALVEMIGDPKRASKRAVFALIRSLENLTAFALGELGRLVRATTEETRARVAKWGGRVLAGLLITTAVQASGVLAPIVDRVVGLSWVKHSDKIVETAKEVLRQ